MNSLARNSLRRCSLCDCIREGGDPGWCYKEEWAPGIGSKQQVTHGKFNCCLIIKAAGQQSKISWSTQTCVHLRPTLLEHVLLECFIRQKKEKKTSILRFRLLKKTVIVCHRQTIVPLEDIKSETCVYGFFGGIYYSEEECLSSSTFDAFFFFTSFPYSSLYSFDNGEVSSAVKSLYNKKKLFMKNALQMQPMSFYFTVTWLPILI